MEKEPSLPSSPLPKGPQEAPEHIKRLKRAAAMGDFEARTRLSELGAEGGRKGGAVTAAKRDLERAVHAYYQEKNEGERHAAMEEAGNYEMVTKGERAGDILDKDSARAEEEAHAIQSKTRGRSRPGRVGGNPVGQSKTRGSRRGGGSDTQHSLL